MLPTQAQSLPPHSARKAFRDRSLNILNLPSDTRSERTQRFGHHAHGAGRLPQGYRMWLSNSMMNWSSQQSRRAKSSTRRLSTAMLAGPWCLPLRHIDLPVCTPGLQELRRREPLREQAAMSLPNAASSVIVRACGTVQRTCLRGMPCLGRRNLFKNLSLARPAISKSAAPSQQPPERRSGESR